MWRVTSARSESPGSFDVVADRRRFSWSASREALHLMEAVIETLTSTQSLDVWSAQVMKVHKLAKLASQKHFKFGLGGITKFFRCFRGW